MKDMIYKYAIYAVLAVTVGFSAFLVSSDNVSPFTTQATLHKTIAYIAPEVSGVITSVNVENGQHVNAGDLLFSIDKHTYELAVRQAEAELHQAQEANSAKWQELQSSNQALAQRNVEWHNANIKYTRYQKLLSKGLITQQDFDDARMNARVAKSAVEVANADILRIKAELSNDKKNAAIELAEAKLATAKLDLSRTDVVALTAGTISNLQLQSGTYISKGSVSLFLVNEASSWLSADFNEKGMSHLQAGAHVWIAFDALPGHVFEGTVINHDRAIFDASNPTNQLSTVTNDTRWIREQQKIRTRIHVDNANAALIAGSRASVIVENGWGVIDAVGYAWIKLVSWFRYIY
ncbi:multidrug transporter [Photobacterium proteolyticum]|uniref:Multidrug transporter n=1 Tax=Photobacterium proteolyticum TaxID=1903952 RepID=A0A1Q9GMF1_9GAMM|nr:HlyD family secretion protein [Photobacterium proteolyticum]OLQ75706.1 multidrug transporter [Photobacterium proteolyticum]